MGDELEDLKRVLRSLVVSRTTEMDIRTLLKDYHELIGARLPIHKYGYRDIADFLRERCNDCFVLTNLRGQTIIRLIVNDKIKHIDQMVQKQKSSKKVSGRPKRRSIPETYTRPPKQVHSIAESFQEYRRKEDVSPNKGYETKREEPKQSYEHKEPERKMITIPEQNGYNLETNRTYNNNDRRSSYSRESKEGLIKEDKNNNENIYGYSNIRNYRMRRSSFQSVDSVMSNEDSKQTTSSSSSTKEMRFEKLKQEVVALLDQPEGVWSTDLLKMYRERYDRELDFSRFGYTSIVSMLCEWDDVIRLIRPHSLSDWLLSDKRRDPPPIPRVSRPTIKISSKQWLPPRTELDPSDALPGIEYDGEVYPEDCMHFDDTIPECSIDDIEPKTVIRIMLGEVYSPSHFWLLRAEVTHYDAMCKIMDDMNLYYNQGGKDRTLALGAVRVGYYCSSVYDNDWHRSLIVKIIDTDKVKVRHVDYGTVDTVQVKYLKPLLKKWAELPQQAIRAKLAGVRPTAEGQRWPHATTSHFLNLVRDKTLYATVKEIDTKERILEVLLIDTTSKEDVCINQELIKTGYADRRNDSTINAWECYLYPSYEALETGDTPNFAEIHRFLRDGIALEYVESYRKHVPLPLPQAFFKKRDDTLFETSEDYNISENVQRLDLETSNSVNSQFEMNEQNVEVSLMDLRDDEADMLEPDMLEPALEPAMFDNRVPMPFLRSFSSSESLNDEQIQTSPGTEIKGIRDTAVKSPHDTTLTDRAEPSTSRCSTVSQSSSTSAHNAGSTNALSSTPPTYVNSSSSSFFSRPIIKRSSFLPPPSRFQPDFNQPPQFQPPVFHYGPPPPQFHGYPIPPSSAFSKPMFCPPAPPFRQTGFTSPPPPYNNIAQPQFFPSSFPPNHQFISQHSLASSNCNLNPNARPFEPPGFSQNQNSNSSSVLDMPQNINGESDRPFVTLSASECEIFCALSRVDTAVAQKYMMDAIARKMKNMTEQDTKQSQQYQEAEQCPQTMECLKAFAQSRSKDELTPAVRYFIETLAKEQGTAKLRNGMRPPPGFE